MARSNTEIISPNDQMLEDDIEDADSKRELNEQKQFNKWAQWFLDGSITEATNELDKVFKFFKKSNLLPEILKALETVSPERANYARMFLEANKAPNINWNDLLNYDPRTIHEHFDYLSDPDKKQLINKLHPAKFNGLCHPKLSDSEQKAGLKKLLSDDRRKLLETIKASSLPTFEPEQTTFYVGPNKMPWHVVTTSENENKAIHLAFSNHVSNNPLIDTGISTEIVPKDFVKSLYHPDHGEELDIRLHDLNFF